MMAKYDRAIRGAEEMLQAAQAAAFSPPIMQAAEGDQELYAERAAAIQFQEVLES